MGCLAAAAVVFWVFRDLRHDDAFITFRYARNLVRGDGFTFNPGERVLGTTTPLFTLISAALWALFGDAGLPTAAVAVNALALGAQALLLYLLLRERLPWTAGAVAALALLGVFGSYTWLALETNTFAALVLATVWALGRRRPVACGIALGLAFLTRYDAALLVPLVPFWLRREGWRRSLTPLAVAAVPVLPWLVFTGLYFGSPLPASLGAKAGLTPWDEYLAHYGDQLLRLPGLDATPWARGAAAVLAVAGLVHVVRGLRDLAPFLAFALAQAAAYAAIGPPAGHGWHLYLPQLAVTLLVLIGGLGTAERLGDLVPRPAPAGRFRGAAAGLLAVLLLVPVVVQAREQAGGYRTAFWLGGRQERYETVAGWVRAHVRPRSTFLASEVGTLGYLTDARMLDLYGLISPIHKFARRPSLPRLIKVIRRHRPDLALIDTPPAARRLEGATGYTVVRAFPWTAPGAILLARGTEVLLDPGELPRLRAGAAGVIDDDAQAPAPAAVPAPPTSR